MGLIRSDAATPGPGRRRRAMTAARESSFAEFYAPPLQIRTQFTVGSRSGARCLELVAQRIVIAAFETAFGALALARFNQVFEAARPLNGRLAALGATLVPLHP